MQVNYAYDATPTPLSNINPGNCFYLNSIVWMRLEGPSMDGRLNCARLDTGGTLWIKREDRVTPVVAVVTVQRG